MGNRLLDKCSEQLWPPFEQTYCIEQSILILTQQNSNYVKPRQHRLHEYMAVLETKSTTSMLPIPAYLTHATIE